MEEMQNTTEWVRANNYTEGSSTYLQENEVTENNNRIEASISIDGSSLKNYLNETFDDHKAEIVNSVRDIVVSDVTETVLDEMDYERISESVLDDISYSDIAEKVWDEYIDIDDIVEKVNMELDYQTIASDVKAYLDISEIAYEVKDEIDIDSHALSLLNQYDPGNGCSLGTAFTACISQALRYLVETNDSVIDLIKNYDSTVSNDDDDLRLEDKTIEPEMVVNNTIVPEPQIAAEPDMYEVLKRVVNEVISSYVPTFNTDPFMRIRMEAKAFDIYNEMKV